MGSEGPLSSLRGGTRTGSRHQPEQTRTAILTAALQEFAAEGVAGARTEKIARAAGVNKALLYYYFKDKNALYAAVLDSCFSGLFERLTEIMGREITPREKILEYVGAHFDYIAGSPLFPKLIQGEMMRAGGAGSQHVRHVVESYFRPTFRKLACTIRDGIDAGDFRPVDPRQFIPSMVAVIVFYFSAAPVIQALFGEDPFSARMVAHRKTAVIDFISAALFCGQNEKSPMKRA